MIRSVIYNGKSYEIVYMKEIEHYQVRLGTRVLALCDNEDEAKFVVERWESWDSMMGRVIDTYNALLSTSEKVGEDTSSLELMDTAWYTHGQPKDGGTTCG